MRYKAVSVMLSCVFALALLSRPLRAQEAAQNSCVPTSAQAAQEFSRMGANAAQFARTAAAQPVPRSVTISAIPGVVAAGVQWTKIWQQAGNSADGILADRGGTVIVAQEDYDTVLRIDPDGHASVAVANAKGVGALSMDRQGNLYGALRTERPGSTKPDKDSIVNAIAIFAPERKMLAHSWADGGGTLTVRPNDVDADSNGGAYFTVGCLYYASPKGASVVADNLRTNGILFSLDNKTLYVTNGNQLVAFDVEAPGKLSNRRVFATLPAGSNGDGMAIDTKGRIYVSSGPGVQVFDKAGKYLGVIPTPRSVISTVFAGPEKRTLYIVGSGADDDAGKPIREGPQHTAATIYTLPMIAQGPKGRAK